MANDLSEKVYMQYFLPGEAVSELDISQLYVVSRPTAKTAIDALVSKGTLSKRPDRSAIVPVITTDERQAARDTQFALESAAIALLVGEKLLNGSALDCLTDRNNALQELGRNPAASHYDIVAHEVGFHTDLVAVANSPAFDRVYGVLQGTVRHMLSQSGHLSATAIALEHANILESIKHGQVHVDSSPAVTLLGDHLNNLE